MDRQEFLQELKDALEGEISPSAVSDNLRYYENYFREQNALGRSDEEVLQELGEARLIARTILQSVEAGVDASPEGYDSDPGDNGGKTGGYRHDYTNAAGSSGSTGSGSTGGNSYTGNESGDGRGPFGQDMPGGMEFHSLDLSKWYVRAGIYAVLILVLVVLFALVGGIFALLIRFAGPILIVLFLYSLFRRM
ncbi:MAG: DUF1700 domain-containing protein [Clostridium sp.]|nr:DUF1700 domain-containing protein [Clostridium sp.]